MASLRYHLRRIFLCLSIGVGLSCALVASINVWDSIPERADIAAAQIDRGRIAIVAIFALVAGVFGWLATAFVGWYVVDVLPTQRRRAAAQNVRAIMYRDGEGKEQDYQRAVTLFEKAAEAGDINAQLNLGCMYGTGRGVPKDDVHCYVWWELAAKAGSTRGRRGCEILARRMKATDLQVARHLSNQLSDLLHQRLSSAEILDLP